MGEDALICNARLDIILVSLSGPKSYLQHPVFALFAGPSTTEWLVITQL